MTAPRRGLAAALLSLLLAAPAAGAADPPTSITVPGTARDFRGSDLSGGHVDFEHASGAETGIVQQALGADGAPAYAKDGVASITTHGKAPFDQWFHDTALVNIPVPHALELTRQSDGRYRFEDLTFFPLDDAGWVALLQEPERMDGHNYSFSYELHTELLYTGTEVLEIHGDDDIWVFVNGRLAVDLGGVHSPMSASLNLPARAASLGLVPGRMYDVDIFFAERHTSLSTLRLVLPWLGVQPGTASAPATAAAGETVACTADGWAPGVTLDYAWLRDGAPIPGATATSYAVTADDAGHTLTCRITGSRRTSASADSGPVAVAPLPVVTPTPTATPTPQPDPPADRPDPPASDDPPRGCERRGRFTVRVHAPKGARVRSARVTLGGRRIAARRAGRAFVATIDLRKRKPGLHWVRITAVTTRGDRIVELRAYRVCKRR